MRSTCNLISSINYTRMLSLILTYYIFSQVQLHTGLTSEKADLEHRVSHDLERHNAIGLPLSWKPAAKRSPLIGQATAAEGKYREREGDWERKRERYRER